MAVIRHLLAILAVSVLAPFAVGQDDPKLRIRQVAFSPDGSRIAACSGISTQPGGRVVVWDSAGKPEHRLELETGVPSISFAPDGSRLALAGFDGQARILDLKTGTIVKSLQHPKAVLAVAYGPDGKLATAAGDNVVRVWDVASGKELMKTAEMKLPVAVLDFAPNGERIVGSDRHQGFILNAATGAVERTLGEPFQSTTGIAFAEGGRYVVQTISNDGSTVVYDSATGQFRLRADTGGGTAYMGYSPAAGVIVTSYSFETSQLTVLQLRLGEPTAAERKRIEELLGELDADEQPVREKAEQELIGLGFLTEPFLKRAMTESPSAEVRLRSRKARQKILTSKGQTLNVEEGGVRGLAVSPDGRRVAVAGTDGVVRLIEIATGTVVARMPIQP